ncbi:MAG: transcriptional repressor [Bacteroidales bacterium]|nr:transcriptional repressor [Bacteroidales bacterium]
MEIEARLEQKGVKPTAIRKLVFKALLSATEPLSLAQLELALETVDKSTIFRTVTLFLEHHLVHAFEDGSGSLKYEICQNPYGCSVEDMHIHFYCRNCQKTYCLPSAHIPAITLPEGFVAESVNYTIK